MPSIIVELKCLTNMHVGNGDVNYNIVDREVEVDAITGYPTINASGVKGALRSFLKDKAECEKWFGSGKDSKESKPGMLKILNANMLARPLRATSGKKAYYMVTTEGMKDKYVSLCESFGVNTSAENSPSMNAISVEGVELSSGVKINDSSYYVIEEDKLAKIALPVIARNNLENGISTNLWYEEVVPHESEFFFVVTTDDANELTAFQKEIDNKIVQFGGNASIGYGLCKVSVRGNN